MIRFAIQHRIGELAVDAEAGIGRGLTGLVGPSGSGKTTILNILAGLIRADRVRFVMDDEVIADSDARVFMPVHARGIGYVFQEPRLFPHLTVRQNVLFGRWFERRKTPAVQVDGLIDLLNLGGLLTRYPSRLSGGEKQRVALARALVSSPRLLLLDEPLASVDQRHRQEILPYLDRVRAELDLPTIFVTHSIAEIESRAGAILEMSAGHLETPKSEAPESGKRHQSSTF